MKEITKKTKRKMCRICGKRFFFISQHGLCKSCLMDRVKASRLQMKMKEGEIYEKWKKGIIKSIEREH